MQLGETTPSVVLIVVGVAALIGAISGGGFTLLAITVPTVPTVRRQVALGVVGLVLILVGLLSPALSGGDDKEEPTPTPTPPQGQVCVPELIAPSAGAVVDNGRTDHQDTMDWRFTWVSCPDAQQYQLEVIGPNATLPVIDTVTTSTRYDESSSSYIANENRFGWTWRVRAKHDGVWGEWAVGTFDIEPVDTD